jgi:endonuclease/exonuclease/phosphatase family metal-dependent hydrolase
MTSFTAVSWNIHKAVGTDGRFDPGRIAAVLAELAPDIAILQEADTRFGVRTRVLTAELLEGLALTPVPFARNGPALGWHGNAILLSPRMQLLRHRRLRLPALEPRGAVMADVAIEGRPLRLVGMHLDLSGVRRRHQVAAILARLAAAPGDPPTLVMGDMNAWRDAEAALRLFGTGLVAVPLGPSFPARLPVARLDRAFVSRALAVRESRVHAGAVARIASDHLPILLRLELGERG